MRNWLGILVLAAVSAVIAGCGGKGIDAQLSTENEASYRESLSKAWGSMTAEQQQAFNWAVSGMSMSGMLENYKNPTPREVITKEADSYIKKETVELANLTSEYAQEASKLEEQEKTIQSVRSELGKIKVTSASLTREDFGSGKNIAFVTQNDSRYGISQAEWDAWLLIDGEQHSDRHCTVRAFYSTDGGLDSQKSKEYLGRNIDFDCNAWNTVEVRRAKSQNIVMQLDFDSVQDFGDRKIMPHYDTTRATYEDAINKAKSEIRLASDMKGTLK